MIGTGSNQPRWEGSKDPLAMRENLLWLGMPPSTRGLIRALYMSMQQDEYGPASYARMDYKMDYTTGKAVYRTVNEFETWFLAKLARHYLDVPELKYWLRVRRAMCVRRQMSERQ